MSDIDIQNWDKEFDLLWGEAPFDTLKHRKREAVKAFISQLLEEKDASFASDLRTIKKVVDMGITQVSTSEMLRVAIQQYSPPEVSNN